MKLIIILYFGEKRWRVIYNMRERDMAWPDADVHVKEVSAREANQVTMTHEISRRAAKIIRKCASTRPININLWVVAGGGAVAVCPNAFANIFQ